MSDVSSAAALIVFDVDGTLFQAHRVTVPAVQRTFAAYGLDVPSAESILAFTGRPVEDYHAWLANHVGVDEARGFINATDRLELDLIREQGEVYPGVHPMLERLLEDGHVLACCSNGPVPYVDEVLNGQVLRPYFDFCCCRGHGYAGKTAMVRAALDQIRARPLIVVGDREDDIQAAHANGGMAIAASYGFGSERELEAADARVAKPDEIPAAVHVLLQMMRN